MDTGNKSVVMIWRAQIQQVFHQIFTGWGYVYVFFNTICLFTSCALTCALTSVTGRVSSTLSQAPPTKWIGKWISFFRSLLRPLPDIHIPEKSRVPQIFPWGVVKLDSSAYKRNVETKLPPAKANHLCRTNAGSFHFPLLISTCLSDRPVTPSVSDVIISTRSPPLLPRLLYVRTSFERYNRISDFLWVYSLFQKWCELTTRTQTCILYNKQQAFKFYLDCSLSTACFLVFLFSNFSPTFVPSETDYRGLLST